MFGSLVNHSSCPRLPPDVERVYLSVLSQVYAKTGGSISPREIEEGRSDIPLDAIAAAAKKALPSMEWAALESSLVSAGKGQRLRNEPRGNACCFSVNLVAYSPHLSGGKSVDLDEAMDLVMNEWTEQCRREEKQAEELFRRFDRNKDDLMSLDEFGALVAHVEGSDGSEQRVKDLFDLLVKEIGGVFPDKVCCAVFRKTAWRIGLGGGSRSTKVGTCRAC